jgi:hypothetical protein
MMLKGRPRSRKYSCRRKEPDAKMIGSIIYYSLPQPQKIYTTLLIIPEDTRVPLSAVHRIRKQQAAKFFGTLNSSPCKPNVTILLSEKLTPPNSPTAKFWTSLPQRHTGWIWKTSGALTPGRREGYSSSKVTRYHV